jgi:hypothetical protein
MIQQVEGLHCSDRFWRSVKRKLRLTPTSICWVQGP